MNATKSLTRDEIAVLPVKQIAQLVAAARGLESFKPKDKAAALAAYAKAIGFAPVPAPEKSKAKKVAKPAVERGPHPGFDAKTFELTYERRNPAHHAALMRIEKQGRTIVERWSKANEPIMSGARLRAFLEEDRETHFPGSTQREIVRIFQDYRARLVAAGFVRVTRAAAAPEAHSSLEENQPTYKQQMGW